MENVLAAFSLKIVLPLFKLCFVFSIMMTHNQLVAFYCIFSLLSVVLSKQKCIF